MELVCNKVTSLGQWHGCTVRCLCVVSVGVLSALGTHRLEIAPPPNSRCVRRFVHTLAACSNRFTFAFLSAPLTQTLTVSAALASAPSSLATSKSSPRPPAFLKFWVTLRSHARTADTFRVAVAFTKLTLADFSWALTQTFMAFAVFPAAASVFAIAKSSLLCPHATVCKVSTAGEAYYCRYHNSSV